jgi:uncharacterized membrane protein
LVAIDMGGLLANIQIPPKFAYLTRWHAMVSKRASAEAVALVIHWMADPVPGLGIAVPIFMPVLVTAVVAVILSREDSAPLA